MNLFQKTAIGLVAVGISVPFVGMSLDKYEDPLPKAFYEKNIEKMSNDLRSSYKAGVLSDVKLKNIDDDPQVEFSIDGVEIEIFVLKQEDGLLKVDARAVKDGEVLKVDNPLYFKNPPLKVPTGKFHKELIDGEEVDVMNYREAPEEALKQIIWQVIKLQNNL